MFFINDNTLATDNANSGSNSKPDPTPTAAYKQLLIHTHVIFGCGMGFASLLLYLPILQGILLLCWKEDRPLMEELVVMDSNMGQAIQACKEEIQRDDFVVGEVEQNVLQDFKDMLQEVKLVSQLWEGEFPFDRAYVHCRFFLSQSA
jgi:hypothetical protein